MAVQQDIAIALTPVSRHVTKMYSLEEEDDIPTWPNEQKPIFTQQEISQQKEKKRPLTAQERKAKQRKKEAEAKAESGVSTLDTPDLSLQSKEYRAPRYIMSMLTLGRNNSFLKETRKEIETLTEFIIDNVQKDQVILIEYVIEENYNRRPCVDPYNYHSHIIFLKTQNKQEGWTYMEWTREFYKPLYEKIRKNLDIRGTLKHTVADEKRQLYYFGYIRKLGYEVVQKKGCVFSEYLKKLEKRETKEFTLEDKKKEEEKPFFFSSNQSDIKNHLDRVIQLFVRDLKIKCQFYNTVDWEAWDVDEKGKNHYWTDASILRYLARIPALANIKYHETQFKEILKKILWTIRIKEESITIQTNVQQDSDIEEI